MKSILDRSFKYTSSIETDLRKTFAKVRRELRSNIKPTTTQKVNLEMDHALAPVKASLRIGASTFQRRS
jgi:hypothetical protein